MYDQSHIPSSQEGKEKKQFFFFGGETVLYKGKEIDLTRSCIKQCELHPNTSGKRKKNVILRANIWIPHKHGAILYKK